MQFNPPDFISTCIFVALIALNTLFIQLAVFKSYDQKRKPLLISLTAIIALILFVGAAAESGFLAKHTVPALPLFFGVINLSFLAIALSRVGKKIAVAISVSWLVGIHGFRLVLELVLHTWAQEGSIPYSMTWTGQNFDILSGIAALAIFPFAATRPKLALAFNVLGFGLLLNVMRVAIFSSPLPFAWNVDPPLQLAFHMPYALIVPLAVSYALAAHILLFRKLGLTPK